MPCINLKSIIFALHQLLEFDNENTTYIQRACSFLILINETFRNDLYLSSNNNQYTSTWQFLIFCQFMYNPLIQFFLVTTKSEAVVKEENQFCWEQNYWSVCLALRDQFLFLWPERAQLLYVFFFFYLSLKEWPQ